MHTISLSFCSLLRPVSGVKQYNFKFCSIAKHLEFLFNHLISFTLHFFFFSLPAFRDHFTVEVPLPRLVFQTLPEEIKEGKPLRVFPVLFNVGINEQQTIAERYCRRSLFTLKNLRSAAQDKHSYYSYSLSLIGKELFNM